MPRTSHQTARLRRDSHRGSEGGTCVMELASMLAGEPFTYRPESDCPVVAGFSRHYNDGVDADDRADLYRFASDAVGSRAGAEVAAARARHSHEWVLHCYTGLAWRCVHAFGRLPGWPLSTTRPDDPEVRALAGRVAARRTRRSRSGAHASALALVDRILALSYGPGLTMPPLGDRPDVEAVGACQAPAR